MRFHNLPDWLAWQETLHPHPIDLGLKRIRPVAERLGLLNFSFPVVAVAGTNGKGSAVALLESIFQQAGYRVGAYTSPHLVRYNERIRIHGLQIEDEALIRAFQQVDTARGDISLTYFEFGTLAAMVLFGQAMPDVVLLEVGLGGRLDAVNLFDADVALVTAIGIDHVEWLGPDRESIGREKAGIFRPGRPAICGDPAPPASIEAHAQAIGADYYGAGRDFRLLPEQDKVRGEDGSWADRSTAARWCWQGPDGREHRGLSRPALVGNHQIENAAAVLMAVESLQTRLPVLTDALDLGMANARLPGRFQVIPGKDGVDCILDVAHNPQAARGLADTLRGRGVRGRTLAVLAMRQDKDIEAVLRVMQGVVDVWYAATLPVSGGADAERLREVLTRIQANAAVHTMADVPNAFVAAQRAAQPGDRVVVFGSFYTVGAVKEAQSTEKTAPLARMNRRG